MNKYGKRRGPLPDIVDPATRSRMMSGIRSADTKPELLVRRGLHARGFRYRLHARDVAGKPDIVLPKYGAALLIHGCFWHGHDCSLFRMPATRREFWEAKIARNRVRDAEVRLRLAETGWRTLTIWECAFRGPSKLGADETVDLAAEWLRGKLSNGELRGLA